MNLKTVSTLGLLACSLIASGIEKHTAKDLPPSAVLGKTAKFTLDGVIAEDEIRNSVGMYGFCNLNNGYKIYPADANFYVGTDGKNIYIAGKCETSPKGILQRMSKGNKGLRVFKDDNYELVFSPNPEKNPADFYRLMLNNKGAYYCSARKDGVQIVWTPSFSCKGTVKDNFWSFEVLIPLKQFGINEWKDGQTFGLRVCRNWIGNVLKGMTQSSWSHIKCEFAGTDSIPTVTYRKNAPVVHFDRLMDKENPAPRVTVYNPADKPVNVQTLYTLMPSNSQSVNEKRTETIPAKGTKIINLRVPQLTTGETANTTFVVTDDKGTLLYRRMIKWGVDKPKVFADGASMGDQLSMRFAYYTSVNRLFMRLDLSGLSAKDRANKINVAIYAKDSKRKLVETVLPKANKDGISEKLLILPDLKKITAKENPSGEYQIVLISGKNKIVRTFKRQIFKWEDNKLGTSDTLVAPFTPVTIKGNKVSVLLRDHTMNDLGLWQQIRTENTNLFTGKGMVLTAVINGKKYVAKGNGIRWTTRKKTYAEGVAEWTAGPLKAKTRIHFDMDGMMMCYFDFPASKVKVDSLTLTVAMPEQETPLFHATTDGLRRHYAGKMFDKWDSKQAPRVDIYNTFCTYLWMGGDSRGFSVSMDNDKGWTFSNTKSSQTIHHEKGQTVLTMNLFASPVTLDKARSIELAFQATPIKPMPEDWRLKMGAWHSPKILHKYFKYRLRFYGSNYCQGSLGNSLLPRDEEDTTIWKELAKTRKTKVIPHAYLKKYVQGFPKDWQEKMRRELGYGFGVAKDSEPNSVTFYTNLRGQRLDIPASRTFLDEWFREEFQSSRDKKPGYAASLSYSIDPVKTYRDYAMYCHNHLFATGACDNLYWDDVYPSAYYDRSETGRAYRLPNGDLQPSTGYFNMRLMIRRAAVLMMELNRTPNNMIHMTNVGAAPLLSYAQQNLDWEDNLGVNVFQKRYTPEYIRTISTGRQFGNLPVALGLVATGGNKDVLKRCLRSGAGVCLTHEIQWVHGNLYSGEYKKALLSFYAFGYGKKDVRVWNYWEKNYPVNVTGGKTSSIYLKKGNEAELVICNYDKTGDFTFSIKGAKKNFTAVNAETGKPLDVKNGKVTFQLKEFDFIHVKLKGL